MDKGDDTMNDIRDFAAETAHSLYKRGGQALTSRQSPLEQAHIHAELASAYMSASYIGPRHLLAAKAHNSASKAWQALYDGKGDETTAVQASARAAESGRKASDDAMNSVAVA